MTATQAELPVYDADVLEFFKARRGSFGAMNLLPDHLPDEERIWQIVRNVMTVDFAIARAFDVPLFDEYLEQFARDTERNCSSVGLKSAQRTVYRDHLARLTGLDRAALADRLDDAAADTMETFNLFIPKQCNMSCRGCYAAAVPVTTRPYEESLVGDFYDGAVAIVEEARRYGARTVYTSGDGEPVLFPRFFDLLEHFRQHGLQWLFFTAGLAFSSETAAEQTWASARVHLRGPSRDRIEARLADYRRDGRPDPTVRALLAELAVYREQVQVYHSLWSTDGAANTAVRRPLFGDYRYVTVASRGVPLQLPSGLVAMQDEIFTGDLRSRLGVEMPVSDLSVAQLPALAAYVVDHGLRSYFEPTILTGRNRIGDLGEAPPAATAASASMLVRTLCGFRNIHQPTVKFIEHRAGNAFVASPGMGVDTADLRSMGVLDPLRITGHSFFGAVHAPLMAYANYVHITGCKCNDFASELTNNRAGIAARWQGISAAADVAGLTVPALGARLRGGAR